MRAPLLVISMALLLPSVSSAVDANSPVTVTLPPSGVGDIFIIPARLVSDLEQDYTEEEFFISGRSTVYTYNEVPVPGVIVVQDPNVPYTTRIIIRRPTDPNDFNGTVVIEWWNSTAGFDSDPLWQASAEYFAREGIVYVGVTNSTTSIINMRDDGCSPFPGFLPETCGTRYADLVMSENGQAFEMVSQIAHMLKGSGSENPLFPAYPVERIFHGGQSQQGGSIVTYATAFHFPSNDGYFVQAAGSARRINFGTPCEDPNAPAYPDCTPTLQGDDRRVATDLPVPVYRAQTQSDMGGVLGGDSRQTDTATFRYYEMTGTAHNPIHKDVEVLPADTIGNPDPLFLEDFCQFESNTLADGPIFGSYLYNAMWDAMEKQVVSAIAPPSGDLMEVDPNNELAFDTFGNALGGIRLPQLDVPTASYTFPNTADPNLPGFLQLIGNLVCRLSGNVIAFDEATLDSLYPKPQDFQIPFNQAVDDLVAARFLLPEDAAKLRLPSQKCIVSLNKNLAKVAKAQGKDICACIKDGSKGKLQGTIEECTTADAKGKVAKAKQKTLSKFQSDCGEPAAFGPSDPNAVNSAAITKELDLIHDLFGSDLDLAILDFGTNKDGAKCQLDAAKAAKKCQDAKLSEFAKCKKAALKEVIAPDALTLADCMGQDPKGKIAKACQTKLKEKLDKKCAGTLDVFPGCNDPNAPGTTQELADCLDRFVECRVCLGLNEADNLDRNCDQFDDGELNASCP